MYVNPHFYYLIHWVVSALALLITAYVVPGFEISGFIAALIAAIVVGFANSTLGWILIALTLPINILTLGLFTFVVDGIVLKMCAAIVPGFKITSWGAAIFGALILAIVRTVLQYFLV
jgi:putative membrane protein